MWDCGIHDAENAGEEKRAAATHLALYPNAATHHLHQPRTDCEAKTRSAVLAGGGSIGLAESFEDETFLVGRNADAGILHRELQCDFSVRRLLDSSIDMDTALVGELDRVSDEVQQHLAQPCGVPEHVVRHIRADGSLNLEAFLMHCARQCFDGFPNALGRRKRHAFQFQTTGVDFREI